MVRFKEEIVGKVKESLDTQEWQKYLDHDDTFGEEFGRVFDKPKEKDNYF